MPPCLSSTASSRVYGSPASTGVYVNEVGPRSSVHLTIDFKHGNTFTTLATLDSGSDISIMSETTFQNLLHRGDVVLQRITPRCRFISGFNRSDNAVLDCFLILVSLGCHRNIPVKFHIVSDLIVDVILGRDFLSQTNATLDFHSNKVTTRDLSCQSIPYSTPVAAVCCPAVFVDNVTLRHNLPPRADAAGMPSQASGSMPVYSHGDNDDAQPNISAADIHNRNVQMRLQQQYLQSLSQSLLATATQYTSSQHEQAFVNNPTDVPINVVGPGCIDWKPSIPSDLSNPQKNALLNVLQTNEDAFVKADNKIGFCSFRPLQIRLQEGAKPFKKSQFRISPNLLHAVDDQISELLSEGIIRPIHSEFNSPIMIVQKDVRKSQSHMKTDGDKNKNYRFIADLRTLNSVMVKDQFLVPNINDLLDSICMSYDDDSMKPRFFTSLDLKSGYFQLALHEDSHKYTAFTWRNKQYAFTRLPQGLSTSGGHFVECVNEILEPYLGKSVIAYLDDILIFSPTFEQHLQDITNVLKALSLAGLKVFPGKCTFAANQATFLGFKFDANGYRPSDKHVSAVKSYPTPTNVKEVRCFLGLVNFFKSFLKDRANIAAPLNALTKKNACFNWTKECDDSFNLLKSMLSEAPVLQYPRFDKPFYISCDASNNAIGAALTQLSTDGCHMPVAYCGRSLNRHEKNYSITKLELLACVYAVGYFRTYLEGAKFFIITDHSPLTSILKSKTISPQLARYALFLQGFDFEVCYKSGLLNSAADCLSRRHYDDAAVPDPVDADIENFPDLIQERTSRPYQLDDDITMSPLKSMRRTCLANHLRTLVKQSDSNRQKHSIIGVEDLSFSFHSLFSSADDGSRRNDISDVSLAIGDCSYNLRSRVRNPERPPPPHLSDPNVLDSNVEVGNEVTVEPTQSQGSGPAKQPNDGRRDKRGNLPPKPLPDNWLQKVREGQVKDEFYSALRSYLSSNSLPNDATLAAKILRMEKYYVLFDDVLYRVPSIAARVEMQNFKLVIPDSLVSDILPFLHGDIVHTHHGVIKTYFSARKKFYWKNMFADIRSFIGKCHSCHVHKRSQHRQKPEMSLFDTPSYPFQDVSIDLIGPLPLSTPGRYQFIGVVVDRFSRYVETFPLRRKTQNEFIQAFFDHVICRHGVVRSIHSDQGREFHNKLFKGLCDHFGIRYAVTSGYTPSANGLVERNVQTIINALRTTVNAKGSNWPLLLPHVTFTLNTSVSSSVGHSPFFLVHGRNPVGLSDVKGADVINESGNDFVNQLLENQKLAHELSRELLDAQNAVMKSRFDAHTRPNLITVGSTVYLYRPVKNAETKHKLSPYFCGPFVCVELLPNNKVIIQNPETNCNYHDPVHVSRLKLAGDMTFSDGRPVSCHLPMGDDDVYDDPDP